MEITPENLAVHLENLFHQASFVAINQLEVLVQKTVKLFEIHMPQVDALSAKRRLGWRQQSWELDESDR